MAIHTRPARLADAADLGRIHVAAWQAAYDGIMPASFLEALDPSDRTAEWRQNLAATQRSSSPEERPVTFVATLDGDVVAMATIGPNRSLTDGQPATGELWMLNADPLAWGIGAATALLARALSVLANNGHAEAILWVVEGNGRARRFYEREGWTFDGGTKAEAVEISDRHFSQSSKSSDQNAGLG